MASSGTVERYQRISVGFFAVERETLTSRTPEFKVPGHGESNSLIVIEAPAAHMELKPGDKLGPYEIISAIGKGGMGEVWKARDPRLGREVAIKVLAQQFSFRFDREARAIAALNHPNICQIHDIGPDYLVLEYIDGKRLCGPLPAEECVRVALQVAAALEEAHARGILHCDLKPANIMMTTSGSAKLLDFGLAKLIGDGDATQTRAVMGTPAYMAPEQLQGKPADARSEIFSFGLVLYELLSGRQAFAGGAATVRDEPAPLDASANLSAFVSRCLRKLPAGRFQTMNEVRTALEQATAVATGDTPSVAVLPFINISADKDNEYFSDGLAEEILNALTRFPDLKVTARTSAFSFRGKDLDIRKIGEALGVRTVLEGSVRRAGNRIRVTAQLINIADGYQLWSERYDRDMTDIFAVQDEISAAIVDALKVKLAPAKILHPPINLEAYHALLKARHAALLLTPETAQLGLAYADEAIALDSGYALAHSVRAQYLFGLAQIGRKPARETLPLARAVARAKSLGTGRHAPGSSRGPGDNCCRHRLQLEGSPAPLSDFPHRGPEPRHGVRGYHTPSPRTRSRGD